jgi:hypothetical protein
LASVVVDWGNAMKEPSEVDSGPVIGAIAPPALSAEIFTIPLEEGRHLVYAPLRRAAFVANAATVNALADLQAGGQSAAAELDGALSRPRSAPGHACPRSSTGVAL